MDQRRWQQTKLGLGVVALLCWMVMFMAGTDLWHDTGRPDLLTLPNAHPADVRAFAYAFYLLPVVLAVQLIVTGIDGFAARRRVRTA